MAFIDYC